MSFTAIAAIFLMLFPSLPSQAETLTGCSELSQLKMKFGPNPVKPSPNFIGLVSGSR